MEEIGAFQMAVPLCMVGIQAIGIDFEMDFRPIEILVFLHDLAMKYFKAARHVGNAEMPDLELCDGVIVVYCPFGNC
jgi:hypothetical protein